ncbi:S41 family peptidase [Pedobacter sp.]|uniref:S41 family peptidase n=1 Tax=Pedobacter sp. TaxID=1411316 RepID=UPI0031D2BA90
MYQQQICPLWARVVIALFFYVIPVKSQQKLPIIKANTNAITIKDGPVLLTDTWTLSPEIRPDRYHAIKSATAKNITFYTDIDSISFLCLPGENYDFAIILKGRDTCYTQIVMESDTTTNRLDHRKLISRELLAMDFMIFRDYMESTHAGLYRYQSKKRINELFDQGLQSIKGPAEKLEFGKTIMQLISQIQDGHTGTNLSAMILKAYRDSTKLFPLLLYFDRKGAYVRCGKLDHFPIGTEILSINGQTINQIKKALYTLLPSDGNSYSKKRHTLNNGSFSFLYRLFFGDYNSFSITYKEVNGKRITSQIDASISKDFDCEIGPNLPKGKDLQLNYINNDIASLVIKTFDQSRLAKMGLDFPKFLEKAFTELKQRKIKKLIVDVRGNGGGFNEYGPLLYAYLAKKDFAYFKAVYHANDPKPINGNRFTQIQKPKSNSFDGKVLFLIDGLSFSTTADFCAIAKSNHRGKFIGEETAGAYQGNNSGKTIRLELPNTRIQIVIPKFRYVNAVKKTPYFNRGVMPDHTIIPNLMDILHQRDVQLNYALKKFGKLEK